MGVVQPIWRNSGSFLFTDSLFSFINLMPNRYQPRTTKEMASDLGITETKLKSLYMKGKFQQGKQFVVMNVPLSKKDKEHKGKKIVWSKQATEQKYFGKRGKPNKLTKITRWN